ncbi:MAG: acetate--CoA ligase family protein [Proteobacteria bacterium]|nr:acetate--CoA ligase family protein [Pseudomonadota bacterium]
MSDVTARDSLSALLNPASIAVVGASPKGGPGLRILRNTAAMGFAGPLHAVNPNYPEIEGHECFPALGALPAPPDCVVIAVPAKAVTGVLEEAGGLGVGAALVVSEGFADAGSEEGRALQSKLAQVARAHGIAVAGPNCMGITSLVHGFANTFSDVAKGTAPGGISVVSQSGGLLNATAELGNNRNAGFNYLISGGNEAVVDTADYIDYLADDEGTRVIACILEGIVDGGRFRAAIERAARLKPVVVLKLGRSERGQKAALAHTGTLAGRSEAYRALFKQNGIAGVDSIDALIETAMLFARAPLPKGDGVAMLMVSGGATAMTCDLGDAAGIDFPEFSPATNQALQDILGVSHPFANPMDTVGMPRLARDDNLTACVKVMLEDDNIDLIGLVIAMRDAGNPNHETLLAQLAALAKTANKPIMALAFASNSLTGHWRTFAEDQGLPIAEDIEGGLKAVRKLVDYALFRKRIEGRASAQAADKGAPLALDLPVGRASLTEYESKRILAAAGIPVTRESLTMSADEAVEAAADIGYPVVLKVQSPDIVHKSDAGGVHLGAKGPDEVRAAYGKIMASAAAAHAGAAIDGVLVQEMIDGGVEFILGMNRDQQFGPLLMCGLGGVFVELFEDVALRYPPLTPDDARLMIAELKGARILRGYRGQGRGDIDALTAAMVAFARFVEQTDGLFEAIDINPLFVLPEGRGVRAADALMVPAKDIPRDTPEARSQSA